MMQERNKGKIEVKKGKKEREEVGIQSKGN